MKWLLAFLAAATTSGTALAEESDFCSERPGQTTPPCVMEKGRVMVETSGAYWTLDRSRDERTDSVSFGDTLVRIGAFPHLEVQLGWSPLALVRTRDRTSGEVTKVARSGDVGLGLLYGLSGYDGPVAIQGFVTLPTGKTPVGAGDWGAGMRLPFAASLGRLQLALTPEVDAKVNDSGHGRHWAYGGAVGLSYPVTGRLVASADLSYFHDDDPAGHAQPVVSSVELSWQTGADTEFDIGAAKGLSHASPTAQAYVGLAHRF